ncbi:MAG: amidohydrolase [Thermoproteota archaeon]
MTKMPLKADLVLLNGKAITLDEKFSLAEALAIKGDKIVAVGTNEQMKDFIGNSTEVVDLRGRVVVPGFEDSHCHFIGYGLSLLRVDLTDTKNMDDFLLRIKTKVKTSQSNSWILGRGWDQDKMVWNGEWERAYKWPTRWDLDTISPENPVFLTRICGHIAVANTLALKLAEINKNTPNPAGGKIDRENETGEPTGILRDTAMELVDKVIPKPSHEEVKTAIKLAMKNAINFGITSIEEAGINREYLDLYEELYESRELCIRVNVLIDVNNVDEMIKKGIKSPHAVKENWLRIASVKIFADGSLGGRTAYLKEDYNDEPGWRGLPRYTQEELDEIIIKANEAGLQVAVHAIGDAANEMVLQSFEKSKKSLGNGYKKLRNRIEHCSVLNPEIIKKYKELDVIASIQFSFATSDMAWAEDRVGPGRIRYTYAWRKLLNEGIKCIGSTDCPVEVLDPILGLYHMVTRKKVNGEPRNGWYPEESLTMKEALYLITRDAAYGTFEEDIKGTIEVGKLADLVVLSQDILNVKPEDILNTKVEMVLVGGRILYDASKESR